VVETTDTWIDAEARFLEHFAEDWPTIATRFGIDQNAHLTAIHGGAGDHHAGGGTVHLLSLSNGHRLVYKPRPLGLSVNCQRFLETLGRLGAEPAFPLLEVADHGDHGWSAFVDHLPCDDLDQVARYYLRIGSFLAVFYLLDGTDFHYENLIANGENPVPVDLETLFHPRPDLPDSGHPDQELAGEVVGDSVLRIGLLPISLDDAGFDISALAPVSGQQAPDKLSVWQNTGTDAIRAERVSVTMGDGQHRPMLDEEDIDALTWTDTIAEGFRNTYRLLMDHREELSAEDGPIQAFRDDIVRAVLRPTRAYHLILRERNHPDLLRDGLDAERHLTRLWTGLDENPALIPALPHELNDMRRGDITLFTTTPASRDLQSWQGEVMNDFFPEAPLDRVLNRFERMGDEDLIQQDWLIRASLGTLALSRDDLDWPRYTPPVIAECSSQERLRPRMMAAAVAIGDRLAALALDNGSEVTWLGLVYTRDHWTLEPSGEDLYSGTAGLVLFLAQLGEQTENRDVTTLARLATETLIGRIERVADQITIPGLFQGWGGPVFTFSILARLWNDQGLADLATRFAVRGMNHLRDDEDLDIIGGAAGFLLANLIHGTTEEALTTGDFLLEKADREGAGIAWRTRVGPETPLLGFSHGAAGIAYALVKLYEATSERRFLEAALAASRFEHGEWKAARARVAQHPKRQTSALSTSWCHGAPGIALARHALLQHVDAPFLREDLDTARDLTLRDGFGRNHCLCHGDLGNLELMIRIGIDTETRDRLSTQIVTSIETEGPLCGTPLRVESPGLMNGLAGIGYGLLRLTDPIRVPSILAIDPVI